MRMPHKENKDLKVLICSCCKVKQIKKLERKKDEIFGKQGLLFPEYEEERKKVQKKIRRQQNIIVDDYKSYTVLFEVDLKKMSKTELEMVLKELKELELKIRAGAVLVTRIFYDAKKYTKKESGYKISSDFYRTKERIGNLGRTGQEESKVIDAIIRQMGVISGLYKQFKKLHYKKELEALNLM